jgi:glucose/mannose-6-phosphate isomerase
LIELDNLDLGALDPSGMHERVAELPSQLKDAWQLIAGLTLPKEYLSPENVIVLGMGGSAIGGDLVRALCEQRTSVPILVCREYQVPAFVGPRSLVIASSYSGETEETLSAMDEAIARGARCVAVGTGGRLVERAHDAGIPVVQFSYRSAPRAALGYSFMCLAGILRAAGLLQLVEAEVDEAFSTMTALQEGLRPEVPASENEAKQLAHALHGRVPVVYGAGPFAEVARRWKGQFNENSKGWAFFEQMPELNHNAVLGYTNPRAAGGLMCVVMLRSPADHPRVSIRFDITAQILHEHGVPVLSAWARGKGILAQMFSLILLGDYVSLYLAYLYATDPSPVPEIVFLKESLAKA